MDEDDVWTGRRFRRPMRYLYEMHRISGCFLSLSFRDMQADGRRSSSGGRRTSKRYLYDVVTNFQMLVCFLDLGLQQARRLRTQERGQRLKVRYRLYYYY